MNQEDKEDDECFACLGTGEGLFEQPCKVCNGSGYLKFKEISNDED